MARDTVFGAAERYLSLFTAIRVRRKADDVIPENITMLPLMGWFIALILFMVFSGAVASGMDSAQDEGPDDTSDTGGDEEVVDPFLFPTITGELVASLLFLVLVSIIFLVSCLYISYRLINRLNDHFRRDQLLRQGLIEYLRERKDALAERWRTGQLTIDEKDRTRERLVRIEEHLRALHWQTMQAEDVERPLPPFIWMLFSVITFGTAWFYLLNYISSRLHTHDTYQVRIMLEVQRCLNAFGETEFKLPVKHTVEERLGLFNIPFGFFTAGIGFIPWLKGMIRDGNRHFVSQWYLEDQLLRVLVKDKRVREMMAGDFPEPGTHGGETKTPNAGTTTTTDTRVPPPPPTPMGGGPSG